MKTLTPKEIDAVAEQLGVKFAEVVEMETRFSGRDISLESLTDDDDETTSVPLLI